MSPRTTSRQARDEHSSPPGLRRLLRSDVVVGVVAAVVVLVAAIVLLDEPDRVARLTITNRSEYEVDVSVASAGHRSWLLLPGVAVNGTSEYHDVLDQGRTWVFAFRAQGHEGGEVSMSRSDLARSNWTIEIPAAVIDRLRTAGAPPHP